MENTQSFSLIAAAAYVDPELTVEFGPLSPAFLPVGMGRLYEHQVALLSPLGPIYLTIPDNYIIPKYDQERLNNLSVSIIRIPARLSLADSIVYALNIINLPHWGIRLLHGDTLVDGFDKQAQDVICVHEDSDDYSWAIVNVSENETVLDVQDLAANVDRKFTGCLVACGYFSFSNSGILTRSLVKGEGNFVNGLNNYLYERNLIAIRPEKWFDFGHLQTYFRSRRMVTTQRVFNSLYIDDRIVRKSSKDLNKMAAEAAWFQNVPAEVKPFTARFLDQSVGSYTIEYVYAPTLSELFVFSDIGLTTWRNILKSCADFLQICHSYEGMEDGGKILEHLAVDKTFQRLKQYEKESNFDISHPLCVNGVNSPSLLDIAEELIANIQFNKNPSSIMHGDFCFSNILYNSRATRICVIDPRGRAHGKENTIWGDTRYDLAKLWHSVGGFYDFIIAGRYFLKEKGLYNLDISFAISNNHLHLQKDFVDILLNKGNYLEINSLTVLLFLSMLPLHSDRPERQLAFIANAVRLYQKIKGENL